MKRVFPLIIILISLSLAGIFFIQYSWLKNVMLVQQEQVRHKMVDAVNRVA
ncbi:MAG: sensor histidine kinase, partial [Verrucomicrobiaceae bacterium]